MFWLDRFAVDVCRRVVAQRALLLMLGCFLILGQFFVQEVKAGSTTTAVLATGDWHSLAVQSDGSLWAWGDNNRGQLGDGTTTDRYIPIQVMSGVTAVTAGTQHSLALKSDGTLWVWGANYSGQLGDGSTTDRHTPIQVLSGVTGMAAGGGHSLALKSDGTLWAWGDNGYGQLGDGTTMHRYTPVQVLSGVKAVMAGLWHSFALKSDGTLWTWGANYSGQLGDGSTTDRYIPIQVLSGVTDVAAGYGHSLALKSDGTLWAWGLNISGHLGDGSKTDRYIPIQVLIEVTDVAAGTWHSLALKSDGTLWAWGSNYRGQLGDGGSRTDRYVPQVMTGVSALATGGEYSLALKSDGTLWAWGSNDNGQLGDGTTTDQPTPIQVQLPVLSEFIVSLSVTGSGQVTTADGAITCPNLCTASYPLGTTVTFSAIPDPGWQFASWGGVCTGTADCTLTIEGPTAVTANFTEAANRYQLDSPVNASFESGIGVVHGWVCEAGTIGLQVDDRAPFTAAYGAERTDSQATCGDTANGFAAAINWSDYGDGEHTLRLLADGQPLTQAQVTVNTLGASYLTGRSATTTVTDFPAAGLNTPLMWSEPHQNFMVDAEARDAVRSNAAFAANAQSHWESPLAGGVESGQALIRGWSCQATRVSVTLDGTPLAIPYGSAREDTRSTCGDTNNGYALAINWNDVGDGPHTLTLNLDGSPVETRTFTIATPAGQGTVTGVQSRHSVQDFPNPGDSLTLQWSEPHQNFRLTGYTAATGPTPQSYHRKVRAYFHGVLGRAPSAEELDAWSRVLLDSKGSVWRPTGEGLQRHLSDLAGWGTETPTDAEARGLVDTVLAQLFGSANDLDRRLPDYYVRQLVDAHLRPRGFVNAVLNDLGLMPRTDGSYGQPSGWAGGPGAGLLTPAQIDTYRARIEASQLPPPEGGGL
jgi:alpha-tubulin suppressor-like RCC1 family protein